jgi:hypothetical protein
MSVHYLLQNICLGQDPESDHWAQQLHHFGVTDGDVILPDHIHCGDDMESLINAIYSQLFARDQNHPHSDQYFLDCTILAPRNLQVHDINSIILNSVAPQEKMTYLSVDSVTDREYDYVQPEVLHTFNPSGFPLHQLELKNGAPTHITVQSGSHLWTLQWHSLEAHQTYSKDSGVSCVRWG